MIYIYIDRYTVYIYIYLILLIHPNLLVARTPVHRCSCIHFRSVSIPVLGFVYHAFQFCLRDHPWKPWLFVSHITVLPMSCLEILHIIPQPAKNIYGNGWEQIFVWWMVVMLIHFCLVVLNVLIPVLGHCSESAGSLHGRVACLIHRRHFVGDHGDILSVCWIGNGDALLWERSQNRSWKSENQAIILHKYWEKSLIPSWSILVAHFFHLVWVGFSMIFPNDLSMICHFTHGFLCSTPSSNHLDVAALHIDGDFHLRDVAWYPPQGVRRENRW